MRTIQEKYNAIQEGNFSKSQFVKDAKRELSQFLSPFNGYEDTVTILKNKGVLTEAKKEKATDYEPTPAGLPAEAISRGIDYELEAIGVNTGVEMPTQQQLDKVTKKVHKNLAKNMNYYLDLIAGESKNVDKHDKPVEATKKNTVDTFNGMKKADLRESVVEKAMSKGYSKEQVEEALNRLKEKKGKDHDGDGDIDSDDYMMAKDRAIKGAMSEGERNFKEGDTVSVFMRGTKADGPEEVTIVAMDPSGVSLVKNAEGITDEVYTKDMQPAEGVKEVGMFHDPRISSGNFDHLTPDPKEDQLKTAYAALEKAEMDGDIRKQELALAAIDLIKGKLNEGRRKKMKGGKVVTENDYETGGYVESMGPRLDKALKMLIAVWEEWKNGPATEPGMLPHAKNDLVQFLSNQIKESEESIEEVKHPAFDRLVKKFMDKGADEKTAKKQASQELNARDRDAERSEYQAFNIYESKQLSEAMKGIISNILKEEVIVEAATGNLSKMADTYNDFEGMQVAVNALENIVTDVESYYSKTRDKIQKIYDGLKDIRNDEGLVVGSFLAPSIEAAFIKDLHPVSKKGFTTNLTLPKTNIVKPGEVREEELEEKETVFSPVTESKKRKYTNKKK